ncbi:MAG: hypothetical protein M1816_006453 [Peltula sp. TS41687]|nr:MAG: hypothetical protein M1816_006453 [Peltula sp. TS41687]
MAYNSGYNPDALPAHAEPEQAAAMLSAMQKQNSNHNRPPPPQPPQQPSYSKPQPPLPRPQQPPHAYSAPPGTPFAGGEGPPHAGQPGPSGPYHPQSPPPSNYGFGPPPPQRYHNRPPVQSKTPPGIASPPAVGADASLFPLFRVVDQDGSGRLSENELRSALVNGDFTTFDPHTVRMMIRLFNTDGRGTIGFEEFCNLWQFLAAWRSLFDRFDEDGSGNINLNEFGKALVGLFFLP